MINQTHGLKKNEMQLTAARKTLAETGKSPRAIGLESRIKVLIWLYYWGYASATTIQLLLNRTSGGYARKLARQGWLIATKTESGAPAAYYTLTEQSLQVVERHTTMLYRYLEIDQYRVNQQQIRHYLIAQHATINGLKAGRISNYETERMFSQQGDQSGIKRPDILWHTPAGLKIGVEIELSAKWSRNLDEFVLGIARALHATEAQNSRYDRFAIISDSPAILKRYRAAMQPGVDLTIWEKNSRRHWVIDKTIKIPDWLINQVDFQLIGK